MNGLPLRYINEENMRRIGSLIGIVNEVQGNVNLTHVGSSYMRFSVELDVTKPIPIGFFHKMNHGGRWMQFTYEKMVDIYYQCGSFGHFMNQCTYELARSKFLPNEEGTSLYGSWIKTKPGAYSLVSKASF